MCNSMADQDRMEIDGVTYVCSRHAAKSFDYTQDYIGQLARSGQVEARRVGGMWYLSLESLKNYKESANAYVPHPPALKKESKDESLVSLEGKNYVSAAHASEMTGYHQDYVGQLARTGTIESRQIGDRWFVDPEDIRRHKSEKDALLATVQSRSVGISTERAEHETEKLIDNRFSSDGPYFTYTPEAGKSMPELSPRQQMDHTALLPRITLDKRSIATQQRERSPLAISHSSRHKEKDTGRPLRFLMPVAAAAIIVLVITVGVSAIRINTSYAVAGHAPFIDEVSSVGIAARSIGSFLERILAPSVDFYRSR